MEKTRGFELVSQEQWERDRSFRDSTLEEIQLPKRATSRSAGYDIFATHSVTLEPDGEIKMPLGWKVYMQPNELLMIVPRSGMGFKYYARLANTVGIIDADYYNNSGNEGHCWIKIRNEGNDVLHISEGQAIAQAIFVPFLLVDGDTLEGGEERNGGFGSTG